MKFRTCLLNLALINSLFWGCDDNSSSIETPAGETPAGETTAGETTAGETTAGETTAGETTAGETTAGETTAGETTAGETVAGETVAGETVAGETTAGETTAGETPAGETPTGELEAATQRAFEWLSGRFDSSAQAAAQPDYFAIQLLGCVVDAPNVGAKALYIEQAVLDNPGAPYRQRLYVIEPIAGTEESPQVTSAVFEFVNEDELVGLCSLPREERPSFTPSDVVFRDGCDVYLEWIDDHFEGGTRGEGCRSTLNGASYATSEVYIDAETIRSWDRGYDDQGTQMWGAERGAYEFIRQE